MAKVSVIVPTYQVETMISSCLTSIMNQTEKDLEVIVVDDASKDHTVDIVEKIQKKYPDKIKLCVQKENKGAGAARNKGLEIASGAYIGFVDGDDIIHPNMYEEMVFGMQYERVDIVRTNVKCFQSEKEFSIQKDPSFGKGGIFTTFRQPQIICWSDPACWNKLFRRELLEGKKFDEGVIFEDCSFSYPLYVDARRVAHFKSCHYFYRQNEKGVSQSVQKVNPAIADIFPVLDSFEEKVSKLPRQIFFKEELRKIKQQLLLYRMIEVMDWKIKEEGKQSLLFLLDDITRARYGDWEENQKEILNVRFGIDQFKKYGLYEREQQKGDTVIELQDTFKKKLKKISHS